MSERGRQRRQRKKETILAQILSNLFIPTYGVMYFALINLSIIWKSVTQSSMCSMYFEDCFFLIFEVTTNEGYIAMFFFFQNEFKLKWFFALSKTTVWWRKEVDEMIKMRSFSSVISRRCSGIRRHLRPFSQLAYFVIGDSAGKNGMSVNVTISRILLLFYVRTSKKSN